MKVTLRFTGLILLLTIFYSCNHGYKFWEVSKFHFVDTALKDNDAIKLLYSSRAPDNNEDKKYYIQIVAVSQRTGDTVNILTTVNNGFEMSDKDKVFNYFDANNVVSKTFLPDPSKNISKVARDPKFDHIADNKYPTVIGMVGSTIN